MEQVVEDIGKKLDRVREYGSSVEFRKRYISEKVNIRQEKGS